MPVLTIILPEKELKLEVNRGQNLREALLNNGISPYTNWTSSLNCGGNGICATCGVWIHDPEPDPVHWHDQAAARFGYPRLSCQVSIDTDLTIEMVDKVIWGKRRKR